MFNNDNPMEAIMYLIIGISIVLILFGFYRMTEAFWTSLYGSVSTTASTVSVPSIPSGP
jgi:hypothetical protein